MGMTLYRHILTMNPLTTIVRPTYSVYSWTAREVLMTGRSDDELRRLYEEGIEAAHQSENDAEWEAFLSSIKKLEEENPWLRNRAFMTERLEDSFVSAVRKSGRAIPDDCTEQIAKLVLLCDEPLMASRVLKATG